MLEIWNCDVAIDLYVAELAQNGVVVYFAIMLKYNQK